MDFIAYTIKVTISCYLEVNKIQIQIIILDVGPHKNEKKTLKDKEPKPTSRIFLEPDSLKDGLHLKLIYRQEINVRTAVASMTLNVAGGKQRAREEKKKHCSPSGPHWVHLWST